MKSFFRKKVLLLFFLLLFFPAQVLSATKILDVRHGRGSGYSRIVLELDNDISLNMTQELTDRNFELIIPDAALAKTSSRKIADPLIERIWWENGGKNDLLFKAETKTDQISVKAFSLKKPPRIVIDFEPVASKKKKESGKEAVPKEKKISLTKLYAKIESLGTENPLQKKDEKETPVEEVRLEKDSVSAEKQYKKAYIELPINNFN